MKLVRVGKVKEVYDEGETLLFKFTDKISVFDKIIPTTIPFKGESLCRTSEFWFRKTSEAARVETHLVEMVSPNEMRVRKFSIPEGNGSIFSINYLIPLEFVARYYVAGSLYDRFKEGKVSRSDMGLSSEPKYGEKLDDPFLEVTTKFGDGGCDLEPILHLTKTEVWRMAKMLGIPESVIAKSPSAGLWEGQRDEDELGMKYEEIDAAVEKLVEQKKTPSNQWEKRVSDLIRMSDHKRRPPESML